MFTVLITLKICSYAIVLYPCSRSQCIINIRRVANPDEVEDASNCAILTIADLAGAEREKRTGNQVLFSFVCLDLGSAFHLEFNDDCHSFI